MKYIPLALSITALVVSMIALSHINDLAARQEDDRNQINSAQVKLRILQDCSWVAEYYFHNDPMALTDCLHINLPYPY